MANRFSRFIDGCDAVFGVLALLILVAALMTGHIPRDLSLWVEAIGGLFIIMVVALIVWNRLRKR